MILKKCIQKTSAPDYKFYLILMMMMVLKILYEIKEENNVFEMIYKPNENKDKKKEKLEDFKEYNLFHFLDNKEYSGNVIRILDKYFIKNNKNKGKLIYKNKKYELKEYFEEIDNN